MTRIYVSDSIRITSELRAMGKSCIPCNELSELPEDCSIVAVSPTDSRALAWSIASRGVPQGVISYVEIPDGSAIICADDTSLRHLRWSEARPLADAVATATTYYETGIGPFDKNLQWRWRLNELVIIAGPYGSGKSTVAQIMGAHFAHGPGRKIGSGELFCSWEDDPSDMRRNVAAFSKAHGVDDLLDRIHYVPRDAPDDRLMSWWYDLVEYYFHRYGTRFFLLDPWNEMDHDKLAHVSETEYVRDVMKTSRRVVDKFGVIMGIVTHIPGNLIESDGQVKPFKISNSFGSVQFANKADRGICVVRSKNWCKVAGHTIIRADKVKVQPAMGIKGTVVFRLNQKNFDLEYDGYATADAQNIWKD